MLFLLTFIILPYFVRPDWIEVPQISPPRSLKTNLTNVEATKIIKEHSIKPKKTIESYEEYFPISGSRSYEDSRSLDDYKGRPLNSRRSSSPFSGDAFDSSNYYRWRNNTSFAKVSGSPSIAESIDYTIVSPESTPLQDDEGLGFPKNIIISSKTPMFSGPEILVKKGYNRKKPMIDSKLDEESMSMTDDEKDLALIEDEDEDEEEITTTMVMPTPEKVSEESDEVPNPIDTEEDDEYDDANLEEYAELDNDLSESTKKAQIGAPSWNNFSFGGFLRYLKQIQDKFLLKTSRTVEEKVMLLENLRERIANSIITRLDNLFTPKRGKRSIWDEKEEEYSVEKHKDGIDFPSAEGALLSIAFLTFAVFLIKLVLQVIAAIKYKYAYYGSGPAAVVGNVIRQRKNARKITQDEAAEILKKFH